MIWLSWPIVFGLVPGEQILGVPAGAAPLWTYAGLPSRAEWTSILDVRSPGEYKEDHVPGAVNAPVLLDDERAYVGTLYARSPFEARVAGASLMAKNLVGVLDMVKDLPRDARILVYCWRGGERSTNCAYMLSRVGWHVARLEKGYKGYRAEVRRRLADGDYSFRRIEGPTGSGKGLILNELRRRNQSVVDLEALARHRGSALGFLEEQPSQKLFESLLLQQLRPGAYVESESAKIGTVQIPRPVHLRMLQPLSVIQLEVPIEARVDHLKRQYTQYEHDTSTLKKRLGHIKSHRFSHWASLIDEGRWDDFVFDLLTTHYDPAYSKAMRRDNPSYTSSRTLQLDDLSPSSVSAAVTSILT